MSRYFLQECKVCGVARKSINMFNKDLCGHCFMDLEPREREVLLRENK